MGTQEMIYAALAAVIAGLVLLSLGSVQRRGQAASVEAVQYRSAKLQMLDFAEVMQRDFGNIGAHMYWTGTSFVGAAVKPEDAIEAGWYDKQPVAGLPGEMEGYFQFRSQPDSMAPPVTLRYEWTPIAGETVNLNDGTARQLYRVRRLVGGNLTMEYELITRFDITLYTDTSSTPILINPDRTRVVDVAVMAVSPLGKAEFIEETVFEAAYRPVGITIEDGKPN